MSNNWWICYKSINYRSVAFTCSNMVLLPSNLIYWLRAILGHTIFSTLISVVVGHCRLIPALLISIIFIFLVTIIDLWNMLNMYGCFGFLANWLVINELVVRKKREGFEPQNTNLITPSYVSWLDNLAQFLMIKLLPSSRDDNG